jgi:hypothetical protein
LKQGFSFKNKEVRSGTGDENSGSIKKISVASTLVPRHEENGLGLGRLFE